MDDLKLLAALLAQRNEISSEITRIVGRPAQIGHVGEFIASRLLSIELAPSAVNPSWDGRFVGGPLAGRTVDVKWYAKLEGLLDLNPTRPPDVYLVLTGPRGAAAPSRGDARPWWIDHVFLFEARPLLTRLQARGCKLGVATSVHRAEWDAAELYPSGRCTLLRLTEEQRRLLGLFASR